MHGNIAFAAAAPRTLPFLFTKAALDTVTVPTDRPDPKRRGRNKATAKSCTVVSLLLILPGDLPKSRTKRKKKKSGDGSCPSPPRPRSVPMWGGESVGRMSQILPFPPACESSFSPFARFISSEERENPQFPLVSRKNHVGFFKYFLNYYFTCSWYLFATSWSASCPPAASLGSLMCTLALMVVPRLVGQKVRKPRRSSWLNLNSVSMVLTARTRRP